MTTCRPRALAGAAGLLMALSVTAGCSFSAGGVDYDRVESQIADGLNEQYQSISRQASEVDCPRQEGIPAAGESFTCVAHVDGQDVRVEVFATDDQANFRFQTIDLLYDGPTLSTGLSEELTAARGAPVRVDCGDGLTVAAEGDTFDCTISDDSGAAHTLRVTSGGYGGEDRWEIIE